MYTKTSTGKIVIFRMIVAALKSGNINLIFARGFSQQKQTAEIIVSWFP